MRILLIEDDRQTAEYIARGFGEGGHICDVLRDGSDGLFQATREAYDVLVVDRMLPGLDGLSLVKGLRGAGVKTPVIFLTSVGGVDDRVDGLEAGGDDYLVKPFTFSKFWPGSTRSPVARRCRTRPPGSSSTISNWT